MRKFTLPLALAAFVATAVLAVGSALAASSKIVPFKASFAGTATTKITGSRIDITAKATGSGPAIGKAKLSGVGVGTKPAEGGNCAPFSGPATITTAKGVLKFSVLVSSTGCAGEDGNTVTVTGNAKFAGGTGKFKKAAGTFTFTGYYSRGTGAFTVKFAGTLKVAA